MEIGIMPDPIWHPAWPTIRKVLTPAAKRGGVPILEKDEVVWIIVENGNLLGAATARLTREGFGEVVLVGGHDVYRWIGELDRKIGQWMRDEGMKSVRAYGRKGWKKLLTNWANIGNEGNIVGYERQLANVEEN